MRPDAETTSSMVLHYLRERGLPIDAPLATAILYALKTDTRDFTRDAGERDLAAYAHVLPVADMEALGRIINPQLEPRYYRVAHAALETATLYAPAIVSCLPERPYPDLVAEMADWLVRRQGTDWCLCAGTWKGALRFSLRSEEPGGRAGRLAVSLVRPHGGSAGGHGMTAGGRIRLSGEVAAGRIWDVLVADFLEALGIDADSPTPL